MKIFKKNILIAIALFAVCGVAGYFVTSMIKEKETEEPVKTMIQESQETVDASESDANQNDTLPSEEQTHNASAPEQLANDNNIKDVNRQNEPNSTNKPIRKEEKKELTEEEKLAIEEQREIARQQRAEQARIASEKREQELREKNGRAEQERIEKEQKEQELKAQKAKEEQMLKEKALMEQKAAEDKLKSEISKIVASGQSSSKIPAGCKIKVNGSTIDYGNFRVGVRSKAYSNVKVKSVDIGNDGIVKSISVSATVNQSDE